MSPKKKVLIIISILITFLLIVLGAIFIFLNNQKTNSNNINPISTPVSSTFEDTEKPSIPQDNLVTLRRPSIDPNHPFTEDTVVLDLGLREFQTRKINPASEFLSNKDFTIYFGVVSEGSGGVYDSPPETKEINNKLGLSITRVKVDGNNNNLADLFKNQNVNSLNTYMYTNHLERGCTIDAPNGYCGSDILDLVKKSNGDSIGIRVYCLTNDTLKVDGCDDVIGNMTFQLDKHVEDTSFGYQFDVNHDYFVTSTQAIEDFKILGGSNIATVEKPTKGYQLPVVVLNVYDRSKLNGMTLSEWVKYSSVGTFEDLVNDHSRQYVSSNYLTLEENKIIFLINDHPALNGNVPVLLFDNGEYIFEYTSALIPFDELYSEILPTVQVKFNGEYRELTSSELSKIKEFFNANFHNY